MKYLIILLLLPFSLWANKYEKFANDTFRGIDNSLMIQIIPTTYPLEWHKPRELIFSLLKNDYWFPKTKSSLGHVAAEINCTIKGQKKRFFLGQSSKDLDGFRNYILQGYGFAILNRPQNQYDYPLLTITGKLDHPKVSSEKYTKLMEKDHISFLGFKLSENACQKVHDYMVEYKKRTETSDRAGNRYGFGADPLLFEGAGCAPFVQTLFHLAGLDFFVSQMDRTVYIPENLIGDPPHNRKVSLWTLLTADFDMSEPNMKSVKFSFPDPQLLFDFVHNEEKRSKNFLPILENKLIGGNKTKYLLLDAASIVNP